MASLSVLVLTPDPTIAELVQAMLESEGCAPARPRDDESIAAALDRLDPDIALVDCDVWCDDERLFRQAAERALPIVMFSPSRDHRHMRRAVREGYKWFTLPIARRELARIVHAELATPARTRPAGLDDDLSPTR
jgi:DNA-binding response OmpR family regulator